MTSYHLVLELDADVRDDELETRLDEILDRLREMHGVHDVDYGAALETGAVVFTGYVDSNSFDDAAVTFSSAVRAAIHAAQGSTPGWPTWGPGEVRIEAPEPATR
ncbi:MAG: hypothetical protein GEU81_16435 [Nitriliruptorales bacterium]|nr:hypothetical protein [Nitriliruptorales bacterium]